MTHGRRRLGQEWLAVDGGEARTTSERSPWLASDSQKEVAHDTATILWIDHNPNSGINILLKEIEGGERVTQKN